MSIINTVSGEEPIPEYGWIEYKVNTNTWTTTEWQAVGAALPESSLQISSGKDSYCYSTAYHDYTINQNTGEFVLSGEFSVSAGRSDYSQSVGGWSYFNGDRNHIRYVDSVKYGHTITEHKNHDNEYDRDYATEYYSRALTTSSRTVPHTSTSVDRNTIVKIHLTEQTGEQFKKYPLTE